MTPEEKAKDLINQFYPYSCGVVGSSFMTSTEYPGQKLKEAKGMALICVDEMENIFTEFELDSNGYFSEVREEIINYEV